MEPTVRWDPLTAMSRVRDEMNRLIGDFFGETTEERGPGEEMKRIPSVDVIDRENEIEVRAEMPGIDKEKIEIEAMPEALMIRAEIKKEEEERKGNYVRREMRAGIFTRNVPMPVEIKPDDVKANYKDGVLHVILPKSEQAKARKPVRVNIE